MARFISVAKAASLIGVSNSAMQTIVSEGELPVVKGKIHIDDLIEKYPHVNSADADMLTWVSKIKDAPGQHVSDKPPSELTRDELIALAARHQKEIAYIKDKCNSYSNTLREIKYSLVELQKESRQPNRVQTMIAWIEKKLSD